MAGEKASRRRTHEKVRLVFLKRWKGSESDHEVAEEAGFGSADAMHQQLSAWGFAGLAPLHDLLPAVNAIDIFQGTLEKLSIFVERLSLRKDHRQGKRSVLSTAKPILEVRTTGENRGYHEDPPDAQPDEHGVVSHTFDQAYVRVPGGAAQYPDEELTAAIAAALVMGYSTD